MAISPCAADGTHGKKMIRLQGFIEKRQVLIRVDSVSFGDFISTSLEHELQCKKLPIAIARVTIADGSKLTSNS